MSYDPATHHQTRPEPQDAPDVRILRVRHVRRAARPHACSFCRRTIPVGRPYTLTILTNEGAFEVNRTHPGALECMEVRR